MANSNYVRCSNCAVSKFCLPHTLSGEDINHLEGIVQQKRVLHAGETLYHSGDHFDGLYAISSGSFKSVVIATNGDSQITEFAFPGEILGFDAYHGKTHNTFAEALETSSVCFLPQAQLDTLSQKVPALQQQLYNLFSAEIQSNNEFLLMMGKRSAEDRLAALLINISSRYSQRGYSATQFRLSMSRTDIANYLGLTIETVSRLIRRFQKEELIAVSQRDITIIDLVGLSELAGTHCTYEQEVGSR
ncbi:fumarate/nitrate reduction transcriptional regulator Fnr [Halioxenophilus sp. WMMB6]|uniref:fumarate/nitrate reduction transcriptional regulator Fnr n=1 Tax=Halioxenophilus sp. WMMB6 TaxID=3073815 RepID=UPI00295E424D|nr:fumarate/nitrate reduction transcriptional regulator Fnr [Halioxenophilus sp. WMMB6]